MACIVLSLEAVKSVNSESIDIFGPKNQEEKPKEMTRTKVSAKGWRHVRVISLAQIFEFIPSLKRLSLIVRVNVVLNRTVVVDSD